MSDFIQVTVDTDTPLTVSTRAISTIHKNYDGNAVIYLVSDEGPYMTATSYDDVIKALSPKNLHDPKKVKGRVQPG